MSKCITRTKRCGGMGVGDTYTMIILISQRLSFYLSSGAFFRGPRFRIIILLASGTHRARELKR